MVSEALRGQAPSLPLLTTDPASFLSGSAASHLRLFARLALLPQSSQGRADSSEHPVPAPSEAALRPRWPTDLLHVAVPSGLALSDASHYLFIALLSPAGVQLTHTHPAGSPGPKTLGKGVAESRVS